MLAPAPTVRPAHPVGPLPQTAPTSRASCLVAASADPRSEAAASAADAAPVAASPVPARAVARARACRPGAGSARTPRSSEAPVPAVCAPPAARPGCVAPSCVPPRPRAIRRPTPPRRRRPVPRPTSASSVISSGKTRRGAGTDRCRLPSSPASTPPTSTWRSPRPRPRGAWPSTASTRSRSEATSARNASTSRPRSCPGSCRRDSSPPHRVVRDRRRALLTVLHLLFRLHPLLAQVLVQHPAHLPADVPRLVAVGRRAVADPQPLTGLDDAIDLDQAVQRLQQLLVRGSPRPSLPAHPPPSVLLPRTHAAGGRALARTPPHPRTTRPKRQSECNLTSISLQSRGKEPLPPTGCRNRPVAGLKSSPGQEIRPRLQLSIESESLYTPPTANVTIAPSGQIEGVPGDSPGRLGSIACWSDGRALVNAELVRYIERIADGDRGAEQ